MPSMEPLSTSSPVMLAWKRYLETDEYANTKRWAVSPPHTEGSLWAAFLEGWQAAEAAAKGPS